MISNREQDRTEPRRESSVSKRAWYREYAVELVVVGIGFALMHFIFVWPAFRLGTVTREAAGQFGSFVGGYAGPFFALIGVLLLYRTLRNDISTTALQSFENKYFELLRLHRANVEEIRIGRDSGRRLFVRLFSEFRCAFNIVRDLAEKEEYGLSDEDRLRVAYYCLFFGVGGNSSRMLRTVLADIKERFMQELEKTMTHPGVRQSVRNQANLRYEPFEGHQSRLGHYYRHLYQMIQYVDQQQLPIDKYEYVKTMRAQLSTHEQALLLVNSKTPIGQAWWEKGFIERYRLVKNIPKGFFETSEIVPESLFDWGYFEWQEVENQRLIGHNQSPTATTT